MLLDMEVEKRVAGNQDRCEALQLRARALTMDFDKSGTGSGRSPRLLNSCTWCTPLSSQRRIHSPILRGGRRGREPHPRCRRARELTGLPDGPRRPSRHPGRDQSVHGEIKKVMDEDGDGRIVRMEQTN